MAGVYSVSVTDAAGCSFATFYEIFEDTTQQSAGVNTLTNFSINAYPNPSAGNITISWTGDLSSFELVNAAGQLILKENTFISNSMLINNLGSGVYFARYHVKNEVLSKSLKFVVL